MLILFFVSCGKTEYEELHLQYQNAISFDGVDDEVGFYNRSADSIKVVSKNNTMMVLLPTNIIKEAQNSHSFPFDKSYVITFLVNGIKYQVDNRNIWDDSSFQFNTVQNGYREIVDELDVSLRFRDETRKEHVFELRYDGR